MIHVACLLSGVKIKFIHIYFMITRWQARKGQENKAVQS